MSLAMRHARAIGVAAALVAFQVSFPLSAHATGEMVYAGFAETKGITLSGDTATAKTSDGTVLRLTPATGGDTGSAFASQTVDTNSFSTAFSFRLSDPGGEADPNNHVGADGITFAVQPISASLGGCGEGLGIGGVSPSVAVEFDTWDDDCAEYPDVCDPSSNHIGVDVDGDVHSKKTANVSPAMDNGKIWYAWIDYDGKNLEVRISQTFDRPDEAQLSYAIDIPTILGTPKAPLAKAFVGFTAGTGAGWQNQDILAWNYSTPFVDGGVNSSDAGAALEAKASIPGSSGCSCSTTGGSSTGTGALLATVAVAAMRKRRKPARRRA